MAVTLQQIRELTIRARSEGVDRLAADLKAVAEAGKQVSATGDGVTRSEEQVAKSMLSASRAANAVVREVDGVARAQQDLEKRQLAVMRAIGQGAITHDQAARTLALLDAKYTQIGNTAAKVTAAHLAHAEAAGLNRMQLQMLQSAASNSFSSIASGAPIMMVAAQQGADLVQAFSMGPNGVGGTFAALGRGALALITPLTLAAAAVATASGVGLYGFARWRSEAEALGNALDGLGRRSGETRDSLAALASRGATTGGLSQSSGRDLAAVYAGVGLGGSEIERSIGLTRSFARVTGTDLEAASKALAGSLVEPISGFSKLNEQLGFADEKTRIAVQSFVQQGNVLGAQRTLLDALAKGLEETTDRTGTLGRLWREIAKSASDAASAMGHAVDVGVNGPTPADRLRALREEADRLRRGETAQSAMDPARWNEQAFHGIAAGRWGTGLGAGTERTKALEENLQKQREIQRVIDAEAEEAARKAEESEMRRRSFDTSQKIYSVLPEMEKRRLLADQIKDLEAASNNPALLDRMAMSARDVTTAIGLLKDQLGGTLSAMQRITLEGDLALRSITARTDAQRAALAGDRTLGGLSRSKMSDELREKVKNEEAQVMAQSAAAAADRLRTAQNASALVGLPTYQRQRLEITQRWDWQDHLNAGNPKALADNSAARKAEMEALSRNTISGPLDEANRALDSQNRLLAVNIATFGQSTDKVVAARTAQEMLNRYIEQGVPITEQMRRQVEDYARSFGRLALAEEEAEKRQRRVVEGMDDLRSTSSSVFSAILHGKGADVGRIVSDKLIDQASNNLSEVLLGPKGKPGGGLFGGFFGGLFGGGAGGSIATADIAAGVVNLSGGLGVGGGGGLFGGSETGAQSTASGIPLPRPSPLTSPAAGGLPLALGGNYRGDGVDPRLTDILTKASGSSPYDVKMISGLRPGDPRFHGQGLATDIQLIDRSTGKALPNYQDATSFRDYEQFAQQARAVQMRDYPELADQFRWGGYFGGPKGKYGAMDEMHFDLGGGRVGMGGGSWEKGLTPEQLGYYPGAQSVGMGQAGAATAALDRFADQTRAATGNLGGFGDGLARFTDGLGSGGGGGGGGLFGSLLKLFGFADGGVFSSGLVPFASGGVFGAPTLFAMGGGRTGVLGEAGPEAIMPLSRGSDGRLGVRASIAGARPSAPGGAAVAVPVTINNYAGAQVSARPKVGAGGQRQIEVTIRQIKREIAEEYGLSPVVGRR